MELFNPKKLKFTFSRYFVFAGVASLLLSLVSVVMLWKPGLNYGIDFRGGIEAHVAFNDKTIQQKDLREYLDKKLNNVSIVNFSETGKNEFLITAQNDSKESVTKILVSALESKYGPQGQAWTTAKMDVVGPKVGAELRKAAILSLIYTCILVTLYLYWRFDIRYSPGALACIFHDLTLTAGFLVVTRAEFSTTVVAALLTLAGYSINDTVVVFDRIRELEKKYGASKNKTDLVNEAINSTLSRTIMTAGTTLVACMVLYFLGGPTLRDFSAALFFGIVVGTYSSAFIAAPLYIWADKKLQASHTKAALAR
jgi:preprotein translocase subunit SecF